MSYKIKTLVLRTLLGVSIAFAGVACDKSSSNDGLEVPVPTDATLLSLSIKNQPDKTGYFIGEPFSTTGLAVEGQYDDGKSYPIDASKLSFTGFNSEESASQQIVKIQYGGKSVDLSVVVYPFEVQDGNVITYYELDESTVEIPSGVLKIAADVFIGKSMQSISFPETLQEIDKYAFFSCGNLKSITLPASLQTFGEGVFDNCVSLTDADLSRTAITEVSPYLFNRCAKLKTVKLPESVTTIGALTFNSTSALKSISIPASTRFIDLDAFRESGIERISLPNNIRIIRQRAFLDCNFLTEVTTFGTYVPVEEAPSSILESSAFQNVPLLSKLEIPAGITYLDQTIVSGCPLLEEITIPETVLQIKFYAFVNSALKRVVMKSTVPAEAIPFAGFPDVWDAFPSTAAIEVPAASLNTYKQASGWSKYSAVLKPY